MGHYAKQSFAYDRILLSCLVISCLMLVGCATTETTLPQSALDAPLPVADMSNALSCQVAGFRYYERALELNIKKPSERERIEELYAKSVELLEHSLKLRLENVQDFQRLHTCSIVLVWTYRSAKTFYPNAPQKCREYYEKAIRCLTLLMDKYPPKDLQDLAEWEYELAYLYYLTGEDEKAFRLADSAWGHKYPGWWNHEFWRWLKACIEQKKMKSEHLPPLRPPVPLKSRLLFPVNLVPDILSELIVYTGASIYFLGGLLTSDEPGWGIAALPLWPYGAVFSCAIGVSDAWEGLPFWNTTIIQAIKKGAHKNGEFFDSYEYFENFPPR